MATDLRGIPGAGNGRRRRPSRVVGGAPTTSPWRRRGRAATGVEALGTLTTGIRPPRRGWTPRRRRSIPWSTAAIALGFGLLGTFVWLQFWQATRVDVRIDGLSDGDQLSVNAAADLDVRIDIAQLDLEAGVEPTLFFDGFPADPETYEVSDVGVRWQPPPLDEGAHVLSMSIGRPLLDDAEFSWSFVVDGTAPVIDVATPQPPAPICEAVTVEGRVETGLARLTVDGEPLEADDGRFELSYDQPPTGPIVIEATDMAGNRAVAQVVVPVRYPATQGVHVSAAAWGYEPLRRHVLDLVDAGKVSAIQLDIKDESGVVGYPSDVELAGRIGAVRPSFDLAEAVSTLHERGVRVVGRIVAFRDAPLATWAVANDRMHMVVQDADGEMLTNYGGFTNLADPDVRRYNLDLALEAVELGVDEILWDYVRRPEGNLAGMEFPGLALSPGASEASAITDAVVSFLAETGAALRDRCVYQGASLFGIAARNPDAVGQSVPDIARHVDYIAPMLYPSHWVKGEYRVDHPNAQPYDIVERALSDFLRKAAGTGVSFNLWVQDFSIGVPYGPAEVRAQIDAARSLGVDNWLLWNASVRYTAGAITPDIVSR